MSRSLQHYRTNPPTQDDHGDSSKDERAKPLIKSRGLILFLVVRHDVFGIFHTIPLSSKDADEVVFLRCMAV